MAVPDTLLPLLVSAGMPSWHQTGASHGPASLIVEVESWMSLAHRWARKTQRSPVLPFVWNLLPHSVLCISRLDRWVPISICRPICPVWRPCLWMVSLGSKSRCLGVPWPSPSLLGVTGPNRHLAWLLRLFWVPYKHPHSQQDRSWLLQKKMRNIPCSCPSSGLCPVRLL